MPPRIQELSAADHNRLVRLFNDIEHTPEKATTKQSHTKQASVLRRLIKYAAVPAAAAVLYAHLYKNPKMQHHFNAISKSAHTFGAKRALARHDPAASNADIYKMLESYGLKGQNATKMLNNQRQRHQQNTWNAQTSHAFWDAPIKNKARTVKYRVGAAGNAVVSRAKNAGRAYRNAFWIPSVKPKLNQVRGWGRGWFSNPNKPLQLPPLKPVTRTKVTVEEYPYNHDNVTSHSRYYGTRA